MSLYFFLYSPFSSQLPKWSSRRDISHLPHWLLSGWCHSSHAGPLSTPQTSQGYSCLRNSPITAMLWMFFPWVAPSFSYIELSSQHLFRDVFPNHLNESRAHLTWHPSWSSVHCSTFFFFFTTFTPIISYIIWLFNPPFFMPPAPCPGYRNKLADRSLEKTKCLLLTYNPCLLPCCEWQDIVKNRTDIAPAPTEVTL